MSEVEVTVFDGTTGERLGTDTLQSGSPPQLDVAALADELNTQRARLEAAEDALDHLIVASLDADLGSP